MYSLFICYLIKPSFWSQYFQPEILKKRDGFLDLLQKNIDPFHELETDVYLKSHGLVVSREFRGLDVVSHIYTAQANLATTFRIRGAVSTFTNIKSQRLARKANFKILKEIDYDCYTDEKDRSILPVEGTKSAWYGSVKYF